jgi:hypothetical protein
MVKGCKCPDGICGIHWNLTMAKRKAALKEPPKKQKKKKEVEPVPEYEVEDGI